jgi:hypothetical protein
MTTRLVNGPAFGVAVKQVDVDPRRGGDAGESLSSRTVAGA